MTNPNLVNANPLGAPAPTPRKFRNIVKVVSNTVSDMPLAIKQKAGIPANQHVDWWDITYETMDAKFPDGTPLTLNFGTKLFVSNKDGSVALNEKGDPRLLDNTQRPHACAQAYAGLGFAVYPLDPSYDEDAFIGQCFVLEQTEFATGKPAYLPIESLGKDFVVPSNMVRIVTPRNAEADNGTGIGVVSQVVELTERPELMDKIVKALENVDVSDDDAVLEALREADLGRGMVLGGAGLLGLAISGNLVTTLRELNVIE